MFSAIVLACAIGTTDPGACLEATDTYGPYKTYDECYARVEQMVGALNATMPVPMQYSFKCENPKGTPT